LSAPLSYFLITLYNQNNQKSTKISIDFNIFFVYNTYMTELGTGPYWYNVWEEFKSQNNDPLGRGRGIHDYLKKNYKCDYWDQREEQYGGPCFVFKDEKDATYFMLRFQ